MIRKPLCLLILSGFLSTLFESKSAQIIRPLKPQDGIRLREESRKEYRKRLRAPFSGKVVVRWNHDPIKITGDNDFKREMNEALNLIARELPLLYNVAVHRVDRIDWIAGKNRGSFAFPNHLGKGHIGFGERDWNYRLKDWRVITLIHEIQHCNTFGDTREAAALWSSHYYGVKLKMHPILTNWARGLALRQGYNPEWWDDNLTNTRLNYKAQPKRDFNTRKYFVDHSGLEKKYANWRKTLNK